MSNFFDQFDDDAVDQKKKPASAGNFFDKFDSGQVLGEGADFSNVRSEVSTVPGAPNQNGVIDDVALALRTGAGRVTQGVLSAPVALSNLLIDPLPARAVRWAGEKLGIKNEYSDKTALGLLTGQNYLQQPDAVLGTVSEIDRAIQEDFDQYASSYTKQKSAEYDQTEGFVDTLKFMAQNPRYTLATLGAEQIPQFAMPIAPGGAKATLALQGLSAGGQAASEVESELREKGYSEDEIASRASGAVLGSAAANILPAAVLGRFGGMAFERAIGGELGEGVARGIGDRALIAGRSVLGETASNIVEETADQAVQNVMADEPFTRGLGKAAAMGGLMGAGTGGVAGLVDAVGARRIDPDPNPQVTTGPQPATDPAVAPEDGGDLDAMLAPILAAAQNQEAVEQIPVDPPAADPIEESTEQASAAQSRVSPATEMQNRDRSRAASVAQMQSIRHNPDPSRLGFSRDPNTGAPMVGAGRDVPEADLGRADRVITADGRSVPVRYAVVEAGDVQASHTADGDVNPAYDGAELKALNNGRTAGLQAAWKIGKADAYRQGLMDDADIHGVSPQAIAAKQNPVLVRMYDPAENISGAESNASQQLGLSPTEQAQTDASQLPDLSGLRWAEDGSLNPAANVDFFRGWFRRMGDTGAANLQDAQGRPNAAAIQRVKAAMVFRAYGDERLVTALAEDVDPDNRNVINALAQAAPAFATLDETHDLTRSVRSSLTGGMQILRDAKARGLSVDDYVAQGDMLGRDPSADAAARFMAANSRSAKRMAEAFKAMAEYTDNAQRHAATVDIFGNSPTPSVRGAMEAANDQFSRSEEDATRRASRFDTESLADANDDGDAAGRRGGREPGEGERTGPGDADGRVAEEVRGNQPASGLFGAPTARDGIDAARRAKDANRDGRNGTGRTDMMAGDGELFAGPRPEQAQVDEGSYGRVEASRDMFATYPSRDRQDAKSQDRSGRGDADSQNSGPEGGVADGMRLRPDATPSLTRRGQFEVDGFVRRFGGSVLADRIARDYKEAGAAQLVGQKIDARGDIHSARDLAALAEAYRNPLFETLRYIYTDSSGNVVGETAVSSRLPSVSNIFPTGEKNGVEWVERMAPEGATQVWLMHNHPSGDPSPSRADISITRALSNKLVERGKIFVAGHVVLNHTKFTHIDPGGRHQGGEVKRVDASDPLISTRGITGRAIKSPKEAAQVGFDFLASSEKGNVAVIATNARGLVSLATQVPVSAVTGNRALAAAVRHAKRAAATHQFAVLERADYRAPGVAERINAALRVGAITDAIIVNTDGSATNLAVKGSGGAPVSKILERGERGMRGTRVYEETEAYRRAESRREDAAETLGVSRGTPGWNYDFNRYEGVRGSMKRLRLKVQDKMKSWDDVQKDIESQTGTLIDDMANVYQLENLMHGKVSTGIERIEQNQVKPLLDAMKKAGVSVETLEEYLYARHAEERNNEIAKINPSMPDGGSGMKTADARAILARADRAKLEPLAEMIDEITTSTRKRLLDHGLITQDQYDAMQGQYDAYVPLRGKNARVGHFDADLKNAGAPGGRGVDSRGKPIQSALGRSTRAENILGEIIGDAQRSVILAEKARVGRGLMRLVLTHPNPSLWTLEPVQTQRKLNSEGEVYEAVVNDMADPSIIAVRHKGQLFRVKVENPELARALNLVGVDQVGAVFRAMGSVQRYFAAVLTKYNPAFIGANATRDAIFGLTGLAAEHGERTAAKAAMNYPHALRSAWRLAKDTLGDSQMDVYAKEFADTGGRTGFVAMPSVEDLTREVNSVTVGGKWASTKRGVKLVADTIGAANDSVENALRLSAYATLRQGGMSKDKAATYAKNLTVNFNRKGEYGSHIGAAILFFNASIQGSHRFATVMSKPKAWAYVGTMVGAQAALAMMAMGMVDDDDGEPLWNKIPKHVKERNLVIPIDESHYMTVPIPYGFNVMVYAGGEAVSQIMNSQRNDASISGTAGDYAANVASALVGAFSPVPLDAGVRTLVPTQLGGIAYDVAQNRTSLGSRIRSENPNDSRPRAVIGKPDTLEIFKVTAKAINRIGGGDDYTKPKFAWADRAPEDLEYIAEQLAGGAGKFIIDTATLGFKAADPAARSDITLKNVPILNRYASTMDELSVQRSMYFERKDSIEESKRRVRSMYARAPSSAEAYMQSLPGMAGARFARRKHSSKSGPAGAVIETNGSPKIVAVPGTAYDAFKKADAAFKARQETVKGAYADVPSWGIPTKETRVRDAEVRKADQELTSAMTAFTKAWNDESAKSIQ